MPSQSPPKPSLKSLHASSSSMGFLEMVLFEDMANKSQRDLMDHYLENDQIEEAWELLQAVTQIELNNLK